MRTKNDEAFERFIDDLIRKPHIIIPVVLGVLGYLVYHNWNKLIPALPLGTIGSLLTQVVTMLIVAGAVFLLLIIGRAGWIFYYNKKTFRYIQIMPHADDEIDPNTLSDFIRRVHGSKRGQIRRMMYGKEWFTYLTHYRYNSKKKVNQFVFYIGAPADRLGAIEHHMNALYPRAEFFADPVIEFPGRNAKSARMTMKRHGDQASLSLAKFKKDQIPGMLKMMEPGSWLQLSFSPDSEGRLKKRIIKANKEVKGDKHFRDRDPFQKEEVKSTNTRFSGNEVSFNVTLSMAHTYKVTTIRKIATAAGSIMHDVNELRFRRIVGAVQRFPIPFPFKMVWTGSELANLFHFPSLQGDGLAESVAENIPHGSKSTQRLPADVLSDPDGFVLGELVHPLIEGRMVRILPKSLSYHWGLTGITGSGKSTLLNTFLKSFSELALRNEKAAGFSFIDPKGETATIVLNQMLKQELDGEKVNWDKVEWISLKDAENPPAMNLLYRMPGVEESVLVDQIMRIISENNFSAAPQAERLLKKCIQTLLADTAVTHTILGIKPLLLSPTFNRAVLSRLKKDPKHFELIQFWNEEAGELLIKSQNAILNRIDIFYNNDFLKRIFGQEGFSFPLRKWMDNGHMVFYNFSGMGEQETDLIGSYLSYLYYRIADTRPDGSMMHQLVIDESQRVHASILPNVIQEMRSKGLYLGVATQTLNNLDKRLQDDLRNIAGNMFVCGQGDDGSKLASKIFTKPQADGKDVVLYSPAFLTNLPERTVVIKTEEKGKKVYCVVKVPPLDRYLPDGKVATYNDELQTRRSNKWTFAKAKELEKRNGLPIPEIDAAIKAYLTEQEPEDPKLMDEERNEIVLFPKTDTAEMQDEMKLFD